MRVDIHVVLPGRDDAIIWKKNLHGEMRLLIYKTEISIVKNIPPSPGGIIFICNQKYIF